VSESSTLRSVPFPPLPSRAGFLEKTAAPSERNFASIAPFDDAKFPELEASEFLTSDQALHYVIVAVSLLMARQQHACAKSFFGINPEDHSNERILKLVEYFTFLHVPAQLTLS